MATIDTYDPDEISTEKPVGRFDANVTLAEHEDLPVLEGRKVSFEKTKDGKTDSFGGKVERQFEEHGVDKITIRYSIGKGVDDGDYDVIILAPIGEDDPEIAGDTIKVTHGRIERRQKEQKAKGA